MLLRKTLQLSEVRLKMDGESGKFAGYASVFGGVDSYGDTIEKGAFAETLKMHGQPKMFYNHDWSMPIGKFEAEEDDVGLFVRGELTPGLSIASDVRAGMKHGTIDGLSIGGFLKKGDYTETKEGRVIHKWSKLVEVSPVVFPADGAARIDMSTVKSEDLENEIAQIETIRDFECFLRDASGFSKGAAQALTARVKALFNSRDAEEQAEAKQTAEILARIQKLAS